MHKTRGNDRESILKAIGIPLTIINEFKNKIDSKRKTELLIELMRKSGVKSDSESKSTFPEIRN